MATCGDIFSGEWEEEEELACSLAEFIAVQTEKEGADSPDCAFVVACKQQSAHQQYGALLDSFLQDMPALLNALINAEDDHSSTINGIFSVLFGICQKVPNNDRPAYWSKLADMVTSDSGSAPKRLQLLLDTFNAIATNASRARYAVFCIIIDFAAANELVAVLAPQLGSVESRTSSWGLNTKERRDLHMKLASALKGAGDSTLTFNFIKKYLSLFEEGDDMQAAFPLAVEASVIAIQDPVQHDCAELLRLPAVAALKEQGAQSKEAASHRLLEIFGSEKLSSFLEFAEANKAAVSEMGLDHDDCVNKMRMLSLVNLATESAEIPYETIASTLQVGDNEVESWVIRVSRAGLVKTRMDQLRQVVVVSRTKVRVFNNQDWCMLGQQVASWKNSLIGLQSMIRQAKSQAHEE
jgi:translation initiation factor 3 subunit M